MLYLHTGSFARPGVTCLGTSISRPIAPCIRLHYLPDYPTLATPARFPALRPCRRQNIFYCCTQLLSSRRFLTPRITDSLPFLVARLPVKNFQHRPQLHPLHHYCLPLVNLRPQCLGSRFLEQLCLCLAYPGPVPLPLCLLPRHLYEETHVQSLQLLGHSHQQNLYLRLKK